jgi:hypothetical protein
LALAKLLTLPVFLTLRVAKDATPWTILSWGSTLLHGVSRQPRRGPSTNGTSPGVSCPFSARGGESPRSARLPGGTPGCPGAADGSHTASFGVAHRFSQPLSDFFLSPPSCHFQTGGALGVSPFRGFFLPRSSDDSSPPGYPLGLPPADCAGPRPRRGHPRAGSPVPRMHRRGPFMAFRVFVLVRIGPRHQVTLMSC